MKFLVRQTFYRVQQPGALPPPLRVLAFEKRHGRNPVRRRRLLDGRNHAGLGGRLRFFKGRCKRCKQGCLQALRVASFAPAHPLTHGALTDTGEFAGGRQVVAGGDDLTDQVAAFGRQFGEAPALTGRVQPQVIPCGMRQHHEGFFSKGSFLPGRTSFRIHSARNECGYSGRLSDAAPVPFCG